jgi:hypothetical protein
VLAVLVRPGGSGARTRWGRRLAAASLLAGPPLAQWARDRKAAGQGSAGQASADEGSAGQASADEGSADEGSADEGSADEGSAGRGSTRAAWPEVRGALHQIAGTLADQAAYGAGVYAGCLRERTLAPVLPVISRTPFEGLRSSREAGRGGPAGRRAAAVHLRRAP